MTWADHAKECADAAERARLAGDDVAVIVLAKRAAEAAQLARLLGESKEGSE
jgi:hypothetical protein